MNIAQYLQLPPSYCNYVDKLQIFENHYFIQCLENKMVHSPQFIINYLLSRAIHYKNNKKAYIIYVIIMFHILATPVFQKQFINKSDKFLKYILQNLKLIKTQNRNDSSLHIYIKKTFVIHRLILKTKLKKRLYNLLYTRSVFINLYFFCLEKRYKFGSIGYIESKINFERNIK